MNAISNPAELPTDIQDPVSRLDEADSQLFTLRRTGRKPIRFQGRQLVEAIGRGDSERITHDLNIYRTINGRIVVELIIRRGLPDRQDLCRIHKFDNLSAAATWLENYKPAEDAQIPDGLSHPETTLPWAVLQAVQLRQTMERIDTSFRCMLSEVFLALDLTDLAEAMPTTAVSEGLARSS